MRKIILNTVFKYTVVFGAILISATTLMKTGQRVQLMEREMKTLAQKVAQEQESIKVLKAEWAYLNNPARLERLAVNGFGLDAANLGTENENINIKNLPDKMPESVIFARPQNVLHRDIAFTAPKILASQNTILKQNGGTQ